MTDRFREQVQEAIAPAYVLDRELKGGGMSRVFVAIEEALGRAVVVKVLRPDLAADVNRERFRREIMLAAKLQHPHIVPVLAAGERGDLLWYSMRSSRGNRCVKRSCGGGNSPFAMSCACCTTCSTHLPTRTHAASCIVTSNPATS